jgi:hypothetical protein
MAARAELIRRVRAAEAIDRGRRSPGLSAATSYRPRRYSGRVVPDDRWLERRAFA